MSTAILSTCVSAKDQINTLVGQIRVDRNTPFGDDLSAVTILVSGEEVDRRLQEKDAVWVVREYGYRDLAGVATGTWLVPKGLGGIALCNTKQEAIQTFRKTLNQLGREGSARMARVARKGKSRDEVGDYEVEVEIYDLCFGENLHFTESSRRLIHGWCPKL